MIVVYSDTVHYHAAMMVVFHAATVAGGAVMHPWQLITLTLITVFHLPIIFHFVINYTVWWEIIIEN